MSSLNMVPSGDSFTISVETITRGSIILEVKPTDTIKIVKLKIQRVWRTPPNQLCLVFKGNQLNDNQTLQYYNIKKEDHIQIILLTEQGIIRDKLSKYCILPNELLEDYHSKWKYEPGFCTLEVTMDNPSYAPLYNLVEALWVSSSKSHRFPIRRILLLDNKPLESGFRYSVEINLKRTYERVFQPQWTETLHSKTISQRMKQFVSKFDFYDSTVIPLFHGTKPDVYPSIAKNGFINLATTDTGYFGKGIYGTPQADYAARVYGRGVCFLCFANVLNALPVTASDAPRLEGRGNYGNCDAHYIPVIPRSNFPDEVIYFATNEGDIPVYDEFVIFPAQQILPRFAIFYDTLPEVPEMDIIPAPRDTTQGNKEQTENFISQRTNFLELQTGEKIEEKKVDTNRGVCQSEQDQHQPLEASRLEEEQRQILEVSRLEQEQLQLLEASRLSQLEEEQRQCLEASRLEEEQRQLLEASRLEEEQRQCLEASRSEEEQRQLLEASQLSRLEEEQQCLEASLLSRSEEEQRQLLEASQLSRLEEEQKYLEASLLSRLEEERRQCLEVSRLSRLEEERRQCLEASRLSQLEEERRQCLEASRLEEERRQCLEASRLEEEQRQLLEVSRLEEEEQLRIAINNSKEMQRTSVETAITQAINTLNQDQEQKELNHVILLSQEQAEREARKHRDDYEQSQIQLLLENESQDIDIDRDLLIAAINLSLSCNREEKSLHQRLAELPPEPSADDTSAFRLVFQLPDMYRFERFFRLNDTFKDIKTFIDTRTLPEFGKCKIPEKYKLVTDFPRRVWDDLCLELNAAGFSKRQLVRVEEFKN